MATNDDRSRPASCIASMQRLPWWAWLALAVFSYGALHALALRPQTIVVDPGDVGAALAAFLLGGVAESLQYVVPAVCLSVLLAQLARIPAEAGAPEGTNPFLADGGDGMTAWEFERLTSGGLRAVRVRRKRFATVA
ncbi:hypothetical protein [Ramlibacter sp. AN1133]|uniref:hypothetical protein n=1 Tax=Ramlibacter sp. AN1133 TaxID=3133429 RepID=UPI0030BCCA4E